MDKMDKEINELLKEIYDAKCNCLIQLYKKMLFMN